MKYGVAVTIVQTGYIEVEADCEEEAKAKQPLRDLTKPQRRFCVYLTTEE